MSPTPAAGAPLPPPQPEPQPLPLPAAGPLAALDPGRCKCGLVRCDPARQQVLAALILEPEQAFAQLRAWQAEGAVAGVVLGDGTGSRHWRQRLAPLLPVQLVDERRTTLEARQRYWQLFPPRGWRRLLPEGLRQPPRPWDDVVAQLLLERHLGQPLTRLPSLPPAAF
mgnify:FL=1|jgi:RNase H-fold protein (predicted Holliday junction resolvase)